MGNIEEALASCDALIRLGPGEATGHVERGLTLAEAGRSSDAEESFRAALARDPSSGEALIGLSRSLLDSRGAVDAIAELDRGILADPGSARLHMLRGLFHQKRGSLQARPRRTSAGPSFSIRRTPSPT